MDPNIIKINEDYYYKQENFLGSGSYGSVYLGYSNKKKVQVAIKIFHDPTFMNDPSKKELIKRQVQICRQIDHPNFVRFYDFIHTNKLYLIMQACENNISCIKDKSQLVIFKIFSQIIDGMDYLNKKGEFGTFHRDIKPQNVLYKIVNDQIIIKIADFGLAKQIKKNQKQHTKAGTLLYVAPNILNNQQYSLKCDVWSVGVMIYQLLIQQELFNRNNITKEHENIRLNGFQVKENFHKIFKELLEKMIVYTQNNRISFKQLKNYLQQNQKKIKIIKQITQIQNQAYTLQQNLSYAQKLNKYIQFVNQKNKLLLLPIKILQTRNLPFLQFMKYILLFILLYILYRESNNLLDKFKKSRIVLVINKKRTNIYIKQRIIQLIDEKLNETKLLKQNSVNAIKFVNQKYSKFENKEFSFLKKKYSYLQTDMQKLIKNQETFYTSSQLMNDYFNILIKDCEFNMRFKSQQTIKNFCKLLLAKKIFDINNCQYQTAQKIQNFNKMFSQIQSMEKNSLIKTYF